VVRSAAEALTDGWRAARGAGCQPTTCPGVTQSRTLPPNERHWAGEVDGRVTARNRRLRMQARSQLPGLDAQAEADFQIKLALEVSLSSASSCGVAVSLDPVLAPSRAAVLGEHACPPVSIPASHVSRPWIALQRRVLASNPQVCLSVRLSATCARQSPRRYCVKSGRSLSAALNRRWWRWRDSRGRTCRWRRWQRPETMSWTRRGSRTRRDCSARPLVTSAPPPRCVRACLRAYACLR
jgi:hypothetical protein